VGAPSIASLSEPDPKLTLLSQRIGAYQ
jgi:hypothetical protein